MALERKHYSFTIKDFYKAFAKSKKKVVDYKTYRKIIEFFFKEVYLKMITEGFKFQFPYSLGRLAVKAFKPKKYGVDFQKTKELGKTVRHLNIHTYGKYYGIRWDKYGMRCWNGYLYKFEATYSQPATRLGIGKKGLSKYIIDVSKGVHSPPPYY